MDAATETVMMSARLPADLHTKLKILAAETRQPLQALVEEGVRQVLRAHGKEA